MATSSPDFDQQLEYNTRRFLQVAGQAAAADTAVLSRTVPSCPDWDLADLIWHLSEVQDFWAFMLGEDVVDPSGYTRPERPDDRMLLGFLEDRLGRLQAGLEREDAEPCWSWSPVGGTVAWVRRRQAQEAMVHRVDVELTVGDLTAVDEALAVDGIDEMIEVMLGADALPQWASFTPDQGVVVLDAGSRTWPLETGRLQGSHPGEDGLVEKQVDIRAVRLLLHDPTDENGPSEETTTVSGTAGQVLLWLWGRADRSELVVEGDPARVDELRSVTAEVTGL